MTDTTMASYVRNNVWNNNGDFSNSDLLWYAKGVGVMMGRALDDPASWWFFAAIHGEYVNPNTSWYPQPPAFPSWGFITSPPNVPTTPLPTQTTQDQYWNQCQHGSWYFFPWHRGYLMALEAQLRQDIISLGGPADWALPYWNYFGGEGGSQYQMPPAFGIKTLPDNSPNPLYVAMRYGPDGNGNIYVPTAASEAAHPGDPNFSYGEVTADAMQNTIFTGTNAVTPPPGFGGPASGFAHSGSPHGNFESNPHDLVHVYVGGEISATDYGLMADPGTAGLDPIFFMHHCNIDRMWAVWNASGNANPTDPNWLNGPAQQFVMPGPGGQPWYYTPGQVGNLAQLHYTYQELTPQPATAVPMLAGRLGQLGAAVTAGALNEQVTQTSPKQTELLGASQGPIVLGDRATRTPVKLATSVRRKTVESLTGASEVALPDKAFLQLENVQGTFDASVLDVFVNGTGNGAPTGQQKLLAGHVALFGLRRASVADGQHGGEGLTFILDISSILDQLHFSNALEADSLEVSIVPNRPLPDNVEVKVGRISIYRQEF